MAQNNNIGEHDVLLGRGGGTNTNKGNIRFREIVASKQQVYLNAKKNEKKVIAQECVDEVWKQRGRFLKRDGPIGIWVEVEAAEATKKASQALRENLDVRHKRLREEKPPQRPRKRQKNKVLKGIEDNIHKFFGAWGETDKEWIVKVLDESFADSFSFLDPQTETPIQDDTDALASYLVQFGKKMPGASAVPVSISQHHHCARVTVEFVLKQEDGTSKCTGMMKQYFIDKESDTSKLSRIVGFPGMGEKKAAEKGGDEEGNKKRKTEE